MDGELLGKRRGPEGGRLDAHPKRLCIEKTDLPRVRKLGKQMYRKLRKYTSYGSTFQLQALVVRVLIENLSNNEWGQVLQAIQSTPELLNEQPALVVDAVKEGSDRFLTDSSWFCLDLLRQNKHAQGAIMVPSLFQCPRCDEKKLLVELTPHENLCKQECTNCSFELLTT